MRKIILLPMLVSGIVGCSFGNSVSSIPPSPYLFSNLVIHDTGSEKCVSHNAEFFFTCESNSILNIEIIYSSQPASYIVLPVSLPLGIESSVSGECSAEPVQNYSCKINMTATNVESGAAYEFLLNGSLGSEKFITVYYN